MSRTVNGKSLKDIFSQFQEDLPTDAIQSRDFDGVMYVPVDAFRKRVDEVLGPEHYNETYSEIELIEAKDTLAIKCKCTIEILDDDFNVILVKESVGGNTLAFPKIDEKTSTVENGVRSFSIIKTDEGKTSQVVGTTINSIPNDLDSACQDAFKRICKKQFGIGKRQLEQAENGPLYVVFVKSYNKTSKGHIFGDIEWEGKAYRFACFSNKVKELEAKYGNSSLSGKVIAFYGKEGTDNNKKPQLVFSKAGTVPPEWQRPKNTSVNTDANAGIRVPSSNTGIKNTQQDTNTTPNRQENGTNVTNGQNVIKFKSRSALSALTGYEGSFKMDCDYNGSNVKVIFLSEYINKMDKQKWEQFKSLSSSKFIEFSVLCCEKNGTYYVANFA